MADTTQSKIRIKLQAYDPQLLTTSCEKIVEAVNRTKAAAIGPIALPTKRRIYCVLRSPHVDKQSREHFETRTHRRLIDVYQPSVKTIDALSQLDLPSGVDIQVKISDTDTAKPIQADANASQSIGNKSVLFMPKVDPYLTSAFEMLNHGIIPQFISHKVNKNGIYVLPMTVILNKELIYKEKMPDLEIIFEDKQKISGFGSLSTIKLLSSDKNVKSIEASLSCVETSSREEDANITTQVNELTSMGDESASCSNPDSTLLRGDLSDIHEFERGDRSIIAIVDSGIDILHEGFIDRDGNTRIIGILDATDGKAGRKYSYSEINSFIANNAVPPALGRDDDPQHGGHGTAMASIAAGGRISNQQLLGIAPEARILFVKINTVQEGFDIALEKALRYIEDEVKDKPVVINLSQGLKAGGRDGCSPSERLCERFLDWGNRLNWAIVTAAGNEANKKQHYQSDLPSPNTDLSINWRCRSNGINEQYSIEFWTPSSWELEFRLTLNHGRDNEITSQWIAINSNVLISQILPSVFCFISHLECQNDPNSNKLLITISFQPGNTYRFTTWHISCRNVSSHWVKDEQIHGWVSMGSEDAINFEGDFRSVTLTIPSTAENIITVGSISQNERNASVFASQGYTRDNRPKPDVVAPGECITVARAGTRNAVTTKDGTSCSAAHVTGAIALMLSLADRTNSPLTTALIIRRVWSSARSYPNYHTRDLGHGILDLSRLLNSFR